MIQSPQPYAPPERRSRGRSCLSVGLFLLLSLIISCIIVSVAGFFLLNHISVTLTPTPEATLPPAPTTPPIFGLSGQASCRHFSPPTTSQYLPVAREDAQKYQLDTLAFQWQIWQESKYNPNAVSANNAVGIAQFLPETADSLGIDPTDPEQALDAAAHLDQQRLKKYADRAMELADHYGGSSARYAYGMVLAAYNGGEGAVENAWESAFFSADGSQVWPDSPWAWLDEMHSETRDYVPAILGCL
jgi:hypothetical protein